ncbi:MAG: hypothetical protein M3Y20_02900, partial [Actinomycetota bacterium]|nr:hypothetical protein [Actinomycetota bacterium]
ALRHAGTTVVAACTVGALAVGVAYLPGLLDRAPTPPAASPSSDPVPSPDFSRDVTLESLSPELVCGTTLSDLEERGQLFHYSETGERAGPVTDDAGFAEVMGVTDDANGRAVDLEYFLPSGAELTELGWTVLVVDADGVVVGALKTGVGPADSPPGTTSTGTTTTLPTASCADGEPLEGAFDVVGVAEAFGTRDGTPYLERATSEPFPVELAASEPESSDPVAQVFTCGQPGPDSIHTLPDSGGLTLAVDLPASPWSSAELPAIPGFLGSTDGQTILANIGQGVNGALVDSDGLVAGFVVADSGDVGLAEIAPGAPVETQSPQLLTVCGPDGEPEHLRSLTGTYTFWPYVMATPKEVMDAEGNATTPPADSLIVIANPQEVTLTP